ncbi:DUF771 domain-containing protein [Lacticaseibacillus pantheris]|uniref:DUF771 domain-containing protein n=1 Tax=Lacticaseibacillus pantheris TaxID=171523 RepID=UPI00265A4E1C|nr:DUF771 domain-containing protein [Lacticaseibacillus pantheris]WKF86003.1 DUF771 domain-containing protein [Lacticaseibacillus pantheris]
MVVAMVSEETVAVSLARKLLAGTGFVVISAREVPTKEAIDIERPWNLKQFAQWAGHSPDWVKRKILFRYRSKMDVEQGGWVTYGVSSGSPWVIPIAQTKKFIGTHKLLSQR